MAFASSRSTPPLPRKPVGPPPLVLRLAAVLAVPLLLYALVATGQKALDNYRLNQQATDLRSEVRALRDENLSLQQQILEARTDTAVETIAREELGLIRPGDHAVVIVGGAEAAPFPRATPTPTASPLPPWQQWWQHFFGAGGGS